MEKTQFIDHVFIIFISQLIINICGDLQRLLTCFIGTAISISLVLPTAGVIPFTFALNLNDSGFLLYHLVHLFDTLISFLELVQVLLVVFKLSFLMIIF